MATASLPRRSRASSARGRLRAIGRTLDAHPRRTGAVVVAATAIALTNTDGVGAVAQTGLNGLTLGTIYALGAVGLTLVYGILKLVNFAHGDFLTFGAYAAFLVNVTLGVPLVVAALVAMAVTAALGLLFELTMWGPMRRRRAGLLQLLLMSIGLAFLIRYGIQFVAGTEVRSLSVDTTRSVAFAGLRLGTIELAVIVVGVLVLVAVGALLRLTMLGKRMRALADDADLAEVAGIDTERVVLVTWLFAGALAGLAGVLAAAITNVRPELGFALLLPIFAAVILGGIGDAYGALAGGLVLGVVTEWSTLVIDFRWKVAVGFAVLIIVLILRPEGIFGRERSP